ncbi:peptide chain release factor N(5)-glutamine methyltransferase [Trichlorobacter sp.]|jgi:release factor glutamine methyltransferase|uniref:peptide chain release factor N(5)-glutamine methyltransferase n=1 Tax=Trichlorobacter sp. TaxID=2911007 RepID=UPI002A3602C0|nr:peptide chain release factor N(5)-glutamine methyltransferase [Trichlorobacter sp.]MDY0383665.1 peptide chain release factor N(5)-glutamine methyltransferase [Trichlorobacter sp.]
MPTDADIWTTLKVLTWTTGYLAEKGVANARREAEWLLCEATGLDRVGLYLNFDKPMSDEELAAYRALVVRRGKREPLQHILGSQEFDGLTFEVSPAVLIPRHDTETLLEQALQHAPSSRTILDIGTGSGCIAIALAKRLPEATITAVDLSPDALVVAQRNAEQHSVAIEFLQGSFFEPLAGRRFDLIVSNPPYITTADLAGLQPEVRDFEPNLALHGGADGLDAYRAIIAQAADHLQPGGWLWFEVGAGQATDVAALLAQAGFNGIITASDPGGIERVVGGYHGA